MTTRRMLMTLLSTGVSAFVLSSHPVLAAQAPFTPATPWSVNRVDPANGSAAYCTLARRFSGNTVITFARNAGGEGTIAVDFQQPLFDTAQTYRIGLQAGEGMKREFMTRPATPNALVLRTGQDPEFFNALSGSTELGVIMDKRRYAFSVPDFAAGTGKLTGCLGGNSTPTISSGSTVAAVDNPGLNKMRAELDALRKENAGIVESLKEQSAESAQAPRLESNAENDQLMGRLASLESEKNALVERLQAGQQQEMQDVSALKAALEDQKAVKAMLESERQQRLSLESALTAKTAEAEKRGEMRARIEQLESSNAELKTLRDAVEAERSKRIAAETALKAQVTASLEEQERVRTRVTELETQNKSLQSNAAKFQEAQAQLEDTTTRASLEQARREAAEGALKEMQMSISKREADMAQLQAQVEVERGKMESAENAKEAELTKQHAAEMARLNAQIEQVKTAQSNEVAERESLVGKVSAEQARREAAEQVVRDMQVSISKREADMAALQAKVDAERKKMESASSARDAELSRKHADELSRLNAEMEKTRLAQQNEVAEREALASKASTEQARREAAEQTVRDMQASISQREAEMAKLQSSVDAERQKLEAASDAKKAELIKQHQDEIARLNAEMEKNRSAQTNEVQAREELMSKVNTEQARRAAAEQAMAKLQNEVESERQKLAKSESDKAAELVKKHSEEIARLNAQIEGMKTAQGSDTSDLQAKVSADAARLEATQKELAETKQKLAQAQATPTADTAQMSEVSEQLSALEKRNNDLMEELKTARAQSQDDLKSVAKSDDKNAAAKVAEIEAKATADKRELQAMLESEKVRREKMEALMAKGGDADDRLKAMADQVAELDKRNAALEKKLQDEKIAAADMLNKTVAPAAGDNAEAEALRRQLDVLKSDNEMLAGKLSKVADDTKNGNALDVTPVVYKGDGQMADALAETKSSLESVMAERDEYRGLLQRERLRDKDAPKGKKGEADLGANAQIKSLEAERVELIRQLEYERARIEQIASGKEPAPATASSTDEGSAALQNKLASVEAEKARLEKQLEVTQMDVVQARQLAKQGKGTSNAAAAPSADVTALLAENKKLQMELAASASTTGKSADTRALETEITALRAQNNVLNDEINKRLAAAPDRATVDNTIAKAEYATREAKVVAKKEVAAELNTTQTRFEQAEAENIRLAKELANARNAPPVIVAAAPVAPKPAPVAPAPAPMIVSRAPAMQPIIQSHSMPETMSDQGMSTTPPPAMYKQASLTPSAPAQNAVQGPDGREISSFLQRANIPMVGGFEKISKVSTADFAAFRWDTGVVFGTAEQQRINNKGFQQAINAYLEKTKSRCSGTFDQSLSEVEKGVAQADVACIMPDGTGAGAAMLFFYKDGAFNAVAHEGNLETFDQAMTTRDRLSGIIKGQM